jgi:hypothetical protein
VRSGDFPDGVSSLDFSGAPSPVLAVSSSESVEILGGCSALVSWEFDEEDVRLPRRDRERDCDRSEWESGRGVISDASSKLSCSKVTC